MKKSLVVSNYNSDLECSKRHILMDSLVRILLSMIRVVRTKIMIILDTLQECQTMVQINMITSHSLLINMTIFQRCLTLLRETFFQEYGTEFLMKTTIHQEKDSLKCWTLKNFSAVGKTNNY